MGNLYTIIKKIEQIKPSFNWANGETFLIYSFTRNQQMTMHTEHIQPGGHYLVVDNVIAKGNAGKEFIQEIHNRGGIVVGLAAGWDKAFQDGLETIVQTHHIKVASTISVTEMLSNNKVVIA